MDRNKKIACIQCLRRKEEIDRLERNFLMLEAWLKQLRNDITGLKLMKDQLDNEIAAIKESYNQEFIGCIES